MLKWLGAGLILLGSGAFGCTLVCKYRQEEALLRMLFSALGWMERELRYRLTPLPELCWESGKQVSGQLRSILGKLAQELEAQSSSSVSGCMDIVLGQSSGLPTAVKALLRRLGASLGCFDLAGQLEGLQEVRAACEETLAALKNGREQRLRSYQTLSLCAGAALIILLI